MIFVSRDTLSSLGDIVSVACHPDGATLTISPRLDNVSPSSIIRVRLLPPGGDPETDSSYAIQSAQSQGEEVFVEEAKDSIEIITRSGVRVVALRKDCLLSIFDEDGRLVSEDYEASAFDPSNAFVETTKRRKPDEIYFGFGEKAKSILRDGQTHVMWNTDTYAYPPSTDPLYQSIPFFIGLR